MIDKAILEPNVLTALGLQNLSKERQRILLDVLAPLVEQRMMRRLAQELSAGEVADLATLEKASEDVATKVLQILFPNLAEMIREEAVAVKKEFSTQSH